MKDHAIYYAGPAKTPEGFASGSFGPTTAGRMDSYVDQFMAAGGSFVMLAKGNRGAEVREACKKHKGFYLGSIGGPAARLAQDCIKKVEVVEYPELGMEAIWRIEVVDFPAFIVIDDKGNDFFAKLGCPKILIIVSPAKADDRRGRSSRPCPSGSLAKRANGSSREQRAVALDPRFRGDNGRMAERITNRSSSVICVISCGAGGRSRSGACSAAMAYFAAE